MRLAAWSALAVYVAFAAGALGLVVLQDASAGSLGALAFAGFAGVGAVIALRQPGNAVGWLLLAVAIAIAGVSAGEAYVERPANPARVAVAWPTAWASNISFTLAVVILPLLFPYGRLPSPRWRPVLWLGMADLVLNAGSAALTPGPLELPHSTGIENPLGVAGGVPEVVGDVDVILDGVAVVLAAASVIVRFRHSRGAERQQLKWFALVGVVAAVCLSVAVLFGSVIPVHELEPVAVAGWLSGLALLGIGLPAATGIAILRYRLYDVDVVIRRTLVYGALSATLGATYLGLVLLIGLAVGRSGFAVAASTLAVAALFGPARGRIQGVVDRRFYRQRYDAARTLAGFGARLRDEVELEALSRELRSVIRETVQPAHVSLWLRSER
jgi:hypothetical protein